MKRFFIILLLLLGLLVLYGKYRRSSPPAPGVHAPSEPLEPSDLGVSSRPAGPKPRRVSMLPKVKELALAQDLEVVAAREDVPGTITITVASRERHRLNIFLNELERSLTLQDFESGSPKVFTSPQGRKRYEVTYRIKYRVRP